jgi:exodeoxyribonuclease VII small subunit
MSKVAANKNSTPPPEETMPFEEAMKKLETIVEAMEAEDLPLENLLNNYEQGCRLVRICQAKLTEAELKIQQLEKNSEGALTVKPLNLPDENLAL